MTEGDVAKREEDFGLVLAKDCGQVLGTVG
jgi:hypothetical protein